jgi:hypothetical protein
VLLRRNRKRGLLDKRNGRSSEDCVEAKALVRTRHDNEAVHENQEQANLMAAPAGELGALTVNSASEFVVVELGASFEPERLIGGKMK